MALDEALLTQASLIKRPVLRFYAWSEPAATFGYFQRYSEVASWTTIHPLIRRPTGGGLVAHLADFTYSLILPPGDAWYSLPAGASYLRMHEWIQAALKSLALAAELSPHRQKSSPGQCFVGAEQFDLLWQGRKIAGAAQRRTRDGLLIQGSVQGLPAEVTQSKWQQAMCEVGGDQSGITWANLAPETSVFDLATRLAREKYSRPEYNQRRL